MARPAWQIATASKDISAWLDRYVREVQVTDDSGIESDQLKLVCADSDDFVAPSRGTVLQCKIGYSDALVDMGVFRVRQVRFSGPPDKVVIVANAVHHNSEVKTVRSLCYPGNLGDCLRTVAARNGLDAAIDADLANIELDYINQDNESDNAFVKRLGREYQAFAAIKRGKLLFKPIGTVHSVTGKPLPTIQVHKDDVLRWSITQDDKAHYNSVRVQWHDVQQALVHDVVLGNGEPEYLHKDVLTNERDAKTRAKALQKKVARAGFSLEIALAGRTDVMTEARLLLDGFRAHVPRDWTITKVVHRINTTFTTEVYYQTDTDSVANGDGSKA